ncbi:hypothetical protein BX604_7588 [Burkholderia sp. JKS000303]|nr:hypothetical protein BX604_7588 [Burkholderia sp. JKS000303]
MSHGDMGWFGISNDKMSKSSWAEQVAKLYESLPEETLLTVVDYHI